MSKQKEYVTITCTNCQGKFTVVDREGFSVYITCHRQERSRWTEKKQHKLIYKVRLNADTHAARSAVPAV